MHTMKITYNKQHIFKNAQGLILKSLNSKLITTGNFVLEFENKIKKLNKSKYCLVTNSGTSALHLAFEALEIKENNNVIIPAINFISSYSMLSKLKANIYLADVDENGLLSPKTVEDCIKKK